MKQVRATGYGSRDSIDHVDQWFPDLGGNRQTVNLDFGIWAEDGRSVQQRLGMMCGLVLHDSLMPFNCFALERISGMAGGSFRVANRRHSHSDIRLAF